MEFIWILDCSNGCTTKVNLSEEKEFECDTMGVEAFVSKYAKELGISADDSVYMCTDDEEVYEIDF